MGDGPVVLEVLMALRLRFKIIRLGTVYSDFANYGAKCTEQTCYGLVDNWGSIIAQLTDEDLLRTGINPLLDRKSVV